MLKLVSVSHAGGNQKMSGLAQVGFSSLELPEGSSFVAQANQRLKQIEGAFPHPILSSMAKNLKSVLQDPGLPNFIKAVLVAQIPNMARILEQMASRPVDTLLNSSAGSSHFGQYQEVSLALKNALIGSKDRAGITFSGRSIKLFSWCQAELKETRHPLVNVLLAGLSGETKKETEVKFDRLADICNLLILQIACGDDIADNIQDEELVPIFVSIPLSDEARAAQGGMSRAEASAFVLDHRGGIFAPYYEAAVTIWADAMSQLRLLFGSHWDTIEPDFLQLHKQVMNSLTYSILMNIDPLDPDINLGSILDNLAPNMMVECFRFLEKALTLQLAASQEISLPESDFAICDRIVVDSQRSASWANSAATASRELQESDLSNFIPFELNRAYMASLGGSSFAPIFEAFLKINGYENHFFSHYYASGKPPEDFNCLALLMLRKMAISQIVVNLNTLTFAPSPDDYALAHLAEKALERISKSHNRQNALIGETLSKFKQHILLIDRFFDFVLKQTAVEERLFEIWNKDLLAMKETAGTVVDPVLRGYTQQYVDSWETFLSMYLLFKRAYDGTI